MKNNKKIYALAITILVIIIGMIIIATKGFNYSFKYDNSVSISFNVNEESNEEELRNITNEVLGSKVKSIQTEDELVILEITSITEEEKQNLINKVNEKYNMELTSEDIVENEILRIDFGNIVSRYISSMICIAILSVIYFVIKYKNKKVWKIAVYSSLNIILTQMLYFSIIARILLISPLSFFTSKSLSINDGLSLFILSNIFVEYSI